jgi:hypothetical protein
MSNNTFMQLIEQHERAWGTDQYPKRPSLAQLLESFIVAVWVDDPLIDTRRKQSKGDRFMLSVHPTVDDFHETLAGAVLAGKHSFATGRKLSRVFSKQKMVSIGGVRIVSAQAVASAERPPQEEDTLVRRQNDHRQETGKLIPYYKPTLEARRSSNGRFINKTYRYECSECGAVLNAPSVVGSPHCPNCASDMQMVSGG